VTQSLLLADRWVDPLLQDRRYCTIQQI